MGTSQCSADSHGNDCQTLYDTNYVFSMIEVTVRSSFLLTVSFLIFKRRQFMHMSFLTRLSFLGYILQLVLLLAYYLYTIVRNQPPFAVFSITVLIFTLNHWLFTAHYLRVACLFRLLFVSHSDHNMELVQQRKFRINLLCIAVCVCIVCIRLSEIFLYWLSEFTIDLYTWLVCGCYWVIALVNLFSMVFINYSQKSLESIGIFSNRWIMTLYVIFWCGFCISETVWAIAASIKLRSTDEQFN